MDFVSITLSRLSFFLNGLFGKINDALYGYILIILLVVGGIYFTVRTRGAQFRLLRAHKLCFLIRLLGPEQ